jgi:hypothetical protein
VCRLLVLFQLHSVWAILRVTADRRQCQLCHELFIGTQATVVTVYGGGITVTVNFERAMYYFSRKRRLRVCVSSRMLTLARALTMVSFEKRSTVSFEKTEFMLFYHTVGSYVYGASMS